MKIFSPNKKWSCVFYQTIIGLQIFTVKRSKQKLINYRIKRDTHPKCVIWPCCSQLNMFNLSSISTMTKIINHFFVSSESKFITFVTCGTTVWIILSYKWTMQMDSVQYLFLGTQDRLFQDRSKKTKTFQRFLMFMLKMSCCMETPMQKTWTLKGM